MSVLPLVLFEDNHCLALNKPAPLLTQAPAGIASLEALARDYLRATYHKPGNIYLGVPHRLDRPVSGVVLFARNSKAAARFAEQFRERQVRKIYWAWVQGQVSPAEGRWEDWLLKLQEQAQSQVVDADTPGARQAVLTYRLLQSLENASLLEVELQTGRMHQIRIQSASRGHPVWGDTLYGSTTPFGPASTTSRDQRIALHARSLTFLHPIRYEPITVTAPPPDDWPTDLVK